MTAKGWNAKSTHILKGFGQDCMGHIKPESKHACRIDTGMAGANMG